MQLTATPLCAPPKKPMVPSHRYTARGCGEGLGLGQIGTQASCQDHCNTCKRSGELLAPTIRADIRIYITAWHALPPHLHRPSGGGRAWGLQQAGQESTGGQLRTDI